MKRSPPGTPLETRFWAKVQRTETCWLWIGAISKSGYGNIDKGGQMHRAHRVAWELTRGPVPAGMCVLHRCDNPPCVNPDHLWLGTHTDNMQDKLAKGRGNMPRGVRHHMAKLTESDVADIRERVAGGSRINEVAADYGLERHTVSRVVRRITYSEPQQDPGHTEPVK